MAFDRNALSALTYANGFTLWHYRTEDAAEAIDDEGYFADAVHMLRVGDFILVNAGVGALPSSGALVVTTNNGQLVDTANLVNFAFVDSD